MDGKFLMVAMGNRWEELAWWLDSDAIPMFFEGRAGFIGKVKW
jgi:hypothetical protein